MPMRRGMMLSFVLLVTALLSCQGADTKVKCTSNDDCLSDSEVTYVCDLQETEVCLRSCADAGDCLALQFCDIAAGQASGVCRDGSTPGQDGGDAGGGDAPAAD
jgi:hypothetical protein